MHGLTPESQGIELQDDNSKFDPQRSRETRNEEALEFEQDIILIFSVPSNTMFLLGSLCYVMLSVVDLLEWEKSNSLDDDASSISIFDHFYTNVGIIGALLLILNVAIDICRCFNLYVTSQLSLCHEDLRADISSAFFFGCAAFVDLWVALPSHHSVRFDADLGVISAHLYFFSAVCAMTGLAYDPSNTVVMLNFKGDIMFMFGSLIDLVVSYISDPDIVDSNQRILLALGLLSSILWFADACLYLLADFYFWRQSKNRVSDATGQDSLECLLEMEHSEVVAFV
jgi:hypothetical protein